jgi:PAS domain S-box-containing protein
VTRLKDGKFTSFSTPEGLSNNFVSSVYQDHQGYLWVGTQRGLNRRKGGKFMAYTTRQGLSDDFVSSICEDRGGNLWVGTSGGLSQWQDGKFTTYAVPGFPRAPVKALHPDYDGGLWVGTEHNLFRMRDGQWTTLPTTDAILRSPVLSIEEDREGDLWLGTYGGGLLRWHDREFTRYSTHEGLSNDFVLSVYQDHEGSIWIGTDGGGLNRLRLGKFKTYDKVTGLSEDSVRSVYQSRDGSLWIGTDGGGLNRLKDGRLSVYTTRDGLSSNAVRSIYEDREGSLWVGTDGGGVSRLKNGKFTTFSTRDGLSNNTVRCVYGDHEGNLWVGTYGGGLNRLRDSKFLTYTTREGLPSDIVWALHEDREGRLWVGTSGGLSRFQDGGFIGFADNGCSAAGSGPCAVLSIYEDPQGILWLGTLGGGLRRFKDGQFTAYTTENGLFDDLVFSILEDDNSNLWMSSNNGIFRTSKKELEDFAEGRIPSISSVSYGLAGGMKNPECNGGSEPAGWRTMDGRLLFANLSGAVAVDPNHIQTNTLPPPVVIERAVINQRSFDPRARAKVAPGKGELEFDYTALSFLAPTQVRFRYRLEGFDQEWVDAGTRRAAYYTNIPPGSYRFRVIASNNDGIWNAVGSSVDFSLEAHFYQTNAFYGLCLLAVILGVVGIHRLRVARLRAREQELVSVVDLRTKELQQDIAERKRTETALQESQEQFQAFMENSPAMASMKDEQGRYVFVNKTMERVFGRSSADLRGLRTSDWLPPEVAQELVAHDAQVLSEDKPVEFEETIPAAGGWRHVLIFKFPFRNASGKRFVGAVGTDITEHKQAEEERQVTERKFRFLFANNPAPCGCTILRPCTFSR